MTKKISQLNNKAIPAGTDQLEIESALVSFKSPVSAFYARAQHTGTQIASTISDFNTAVRTNRLDQMAVPTALVDLSGQNLDNIQNLIHDLSTSGTDVDFTEDELQEISISANTTFTGTNYATGKSKVIKITTDGTLRTLAFPTGWKFVGPKPVDQAASKTGILSLTCFTGAEAGVVASYAVEE